MVSTEMIGEMLQGLEYPTRKQEILVHATTHGANREILHLLDRIAPREYTSQEDLWDEINALRKSA